MSVLKIVLFALFSAVCIFVLKTQKSPIAQPLGAICCVLIFVYLVGDNGSFFKEAGVILEENGYTEYAKTLVKALGVAFACETGADVCRELGETGIASKIELAGKIEILVFSLPVAMDLLNAARGLMDI